MLKLLDNVSHPELERADSPRVMPRNSVSYMFTECARLVSGAIPTEKQPAIRTQALQKQVEARRNVRRVNVGQVNKELGNVSLSNDVVACQPTEAIGTRKRTANDCLRSVRKLFNCVLGDLFELLTSHNARSGLTFKISPQFRVMAEARASKVQ